MICRPSDLSPLRSRLLLSPLLLVVLALLVASSFERTEANYLAIQLFSDSLCTVPVNSSVGSPSISFASLSEPGVDSCAASPASLAAQGFPAYAGSCRQQVDVTTNTTGGTNSKLNALATLRLFTHSTCQVDGSDLQYSYYTSDTSGLHNATSCVPIGMSVTANWTNNNPVFIRQASFHAQFNCSDVSADNAAAARLVPWIAMLLSSYITLVVMSSLG